MKQYILLGVIGLICVAGPGRSENWNQFRGPTLQGLSQVADLPVRWSPETGVRWKVQIPGSGWSQPIVWGDRVFLTCAESDEGRKPRLGDWSPGIPSVGEILFGGGGTDAGTTSTSEDAPNASENSTRPQEALPGRTAPALGRRLTGVLRGTGLPPPTGRYRWQVLCLDGATGYVLWKRTVREGAPPGRAHPNNTYATETPATDGERVFAFFGMTGMYCFDLSGNLLWSRDLGAFPTRMGWGTGSSPVLLDDRVFVQCDNEEQSFLVALDKRTGEDLWRVPREEGTNWSTPFVWRNRVRTELVAAGGNKMRSYDPATGSLLWEYAASGRTGSTPVGDEERLFVDSYDWLTGRSGVLAAINPGASGDISPRGRARTNPFVAWTVRLNALRAASPILVDGRLYVLEQQSGIIRCFDAESGQLLYRERLSGATGFTASPLATAGRIYVLDQEGVTLVLESGSKLNTIAVNRLPTEMFWSSPAVLGNGLLLRGVDHLYYIAPD